MIGSCVDQPRVNISDKVDLIISNSTQPSTQTVIPGANVSEPLSKPENNEIVNPQYLNAVYPQQWATGNGTKNSPWANNCLKKAYTACSVGGTIYLKAGYYQLDGELELNKTVNLIGEGRGKTIILTANTMTGINVVKDNCTLRGFTVDASAMTSASASAINVGYCDYVVVEDIETKNSSYYGINIINVNHSKFQNISSHNNKRHGMHPGCSITGKHQYNTFENLHLYDNGVNGFDDYSIAYGRNNTYNNLNCHNNGEHGIVIYCQIGSVLSNSSANNNNLNGMFFQDIENFNVNNCSTNYNKNAGIFLSNGIKNVAINNTIVKNNGTGVKIYGCDGLTFTSCQCYDDRDTPLQQYGLEFYQINNNINLLYCKLSPNQKGEIYNPQKIVINIISSKMLSIL